MFTNLLPSYFIASTTAVMVDLLSGLSPYVILIIAIIGTGILIEVILHSHKK